MEREYVFNLQAVEIFIIKNFLPPEVCDYLCRLIQSNHERSMVTGRGDERKVVSRTRTSQSSFLNQDDKVVNDVNLRIAQELNIPNSYAEPMQGQLYHEGEFFNDHTDYFDSQTLDVDSTVSGQRTWTSMIYLNDVPEGGHTEFPIIGKSFAPVKGTAVFWKNSDGRGMENPATLHCGCPVIRGEKMIVTKWFRENEYKPLEDQKMGGSHQKGLTPIATLNGDTRFVKIEVVNGIPHARYRSNKDIPAVTREGFKKTAIPAELYQKVLAFYNNGRQNSRPEFDPTDQSEHLSQYIQSRETHYPTKMIQLTSELKLDIFNAVQGVLEDWSGRKLAATYCYGIRTYNRGAALIKHIDGFETRIVSAILNIDQQVEEPWPLQIDDHEGVEHEVFLNPGEMALYESAVLMHGRVKPLKGDYYSNLFVHFINVT